jgi:quinolinate synthase
VDAVVDNYNCQTDGVSGANPRSAAFDDIFQSIPQEYLDAPVSELRQRIGKAKEALKDDLFLLAHHYQKDEIVEFADATGDSLQLSQLAAKDTSRYIVFCGVHFMAETADILTTPEQAVILPDLTAGCQMADMVTLPDLEACWAALTDAPVAPGGKPIELLPITYVNSSAAVKAFVGEKGGYTVTSSNAHKILQIALETGNTILFVPDQHLGRNTCYDLWVGLQEMAIWSPLKGELDADPFGLADPATPPADPRANPRVILWDGYCSVHQQFLPQHVEAVREKVPGIEVIVHPECRFDVVQAADFAGSTSALIAKVEQAQSSADPKQLQRAFAIGTDNNLVGRLKANNPDVRVESRGRSDRD